LKFTSIGKKIKTWLGLEKKNHVDQDIVHQENVKKLIESGCSKPVRRRPDKGESKDK
jgi:hypothetical protein